MLTHELRDRLILTGLGGLSNEEAADVALGVLRDVMRESARGHWDRVKSGESTVSWKDELYNDLSELYSETTV